MVWTKEQMVERAAQELRDGDVVNLGIGMPTLVANQADKNIAKLAKSMSVKKRTKQKIDKETSPHDAESMSGVDEELTDLDSKRDSFAKGCQITIITKIIIVIIRRRVT